MTVDDIPLFWVEPWRWAAPAWHVGYGAPARDVDCHAARLIYSGWSTCFGLDRRWRPPGDPRWIEVVRASPAVLHGVASMLGHLAMLRAGVDSLMCHAPSDRWFALALKYRDVNCMRTVFDAARVASSAAHTSGVCVLRAMARRDWPEIDSRIAMLVPPGPYAIGNAVNTGHLPRQRHALTVEWIDVGRCLSLCGAATRQGGGRSIREGDQ